MNLLNKSNIVNGNIIEDVDVYQIIDAFTYQVAYDLLISGSIAIGSGSTLPNVKLYIAGGNSANAKIEGGVSASSFTGSFLGNGAGITGVISSSYSVSASYSNFAQNAGTASVANNVSGAAGFIPVFTSPLILGPSLMFQSGSSIILNNGSGPTPFTFDIGGSGRFTSNLTVSGSFTVVQGITMVSGNLTLPTSSTTQGVIYQNGVPFISTYYGGGSGSNNIYIGSGSGNFTSANAASNIAIGFNTLKSITGGNGNIAIGSNVGILLTSATGNTLIGSNVGSLLTTGNTNTAIGSGAATNLTTGFENTLIGGNAGFGLTTGTRNTFIGLGAGRVASTATNNIVITCNTNATQLGITTGTGNVIVNPFNLNVTSGNNNTLLGNGAGFNINQGNNNTFLGFNAGVGFNSASLNTAIGFGAASAISSLFTGSVSGALVTNVTVIVNDASGILTQNLTGSNIFVYGLNQNVLLGKVIDNGFKFQVSGTQHILATSGSSALVIAPSSGFGGLTIGSDGNLSFGINQGYISRLSNQYIILPGAGGTLPGRLMPNDNTHGWLFSNSINGALGVNDTHGVHVKDNEVSFAAATTQPTVIRFQYNFGINGGFRRPYLNIISDDLQPNSSTGSTFLIKAGNSGLSSPNNLGNPGDLYLGAGNLASGSALFNVQGGNLFISGGYGSGTGSAGVINFYTATPLTASSSTPQNLSLVMSLSGSGFYSFASQSFFSGSLNVQANENISVLVQTGSFSMLGRHIQYVFTGTTSSNWTLPSISTTLGAYFMIKSRGSANLTLQGSGSDQLFANIATGSLTLNTGNAVILVNDGTYWLVE